MSNCSLLLFTLQFPEWLKESGFAVRNLKLYVMSCVSSHGGRRAGSQGEELSSHRASRSGPSAWGWAALWRTRGVGDVQLACQRRPVVASLPAHTPNPSFKTYTREKTLSTVLFTSPYQQRHSPSQSALQFLRQGLKPQKPSTWFSDTLKINPAVPVSVQRSITVPSACSRGWL